MYSITVTVPQSICMLDSHIHSSACWLDVFPQGRLMGPPGNTHFTSVRRDI